MSPAWPLWGTTGIRRKPAVDLEVCWSVVAGQAADRAFAVGLGGQAVPACLIQSLVAHEFGDEDEVVALAETGRERFTNYAEWVGGTTGR